MSTPAEAMEETCPTTPGLSREGGFDPGLDWSSLKEDPTANWHIIGWLVCLLLLAITWIVSSVTITKHLKNYYEPEIQRQKLRVILFPPVFATLSWFSYLRYDYSTTIMFFATVFESFAVFNLFTCLQAYLEPFRVEAGDLKESKDTNIMFIFGLHLKSMWGMHYRIITDILVFQYPIWSLLEAFMSIFAEMKGRYCEGVYSFNGAYVYLTIINFISLSIILTALFTYLDVFHREWKRGNVRAHGMFWCVKGPIMFIFYFGDILLTGLTTANVIKPTDGTHGSIAWPADAVKNGLYVIIICCVMFVDCFMMHRFFGPQDNIQHAQQTGQIKKMSFFKAFVDAYLAYIPEFIYKTLCCGVDSYKLMKKRKALRKKKKLEASNANPTDRLLNESLNHQEYNMEHISQQPSTGMTEYNTPPQGLYQENIYPQPGYTTTTTTTSQPQMAHQHQGSNQYGGYPTK